MQSQTRNEGDGGRLRPRGQNETGPCPRVGRRQRIGSSELGCACMQLERYIRKNYGRADQSNGRAVSKRVVKEVQMQARLGQQPETNKEHTASNISAMIRTMCARPQRRARGPMRHRHAMTDVLDDRRTCLIIVLIDVNGR